MTQELQQFVEKTWTSIHGPLKIKDMTDDHIINVIGHLALRNQYDYYYWNFMELSRSKGITSEDLKRFQIPHRDENGHLVMLNYKTYKLERV